MSKMVSTVLSAHEERNVATAEAFKAMDVEGDNQVRSEGAKDEGYNAVQTPLPLLTPRFARRSSTASRSSTTYAATSSAGASLTGRPGRRRSRQSSTSSWRIWTLTRTGWSAG